MNIKDGWWALLALVIFIVAFFIGFGFAREDVQKDCDKNGQTDFVREIYTCHKQPQNGSERT